MGFEGLGDFNATRAAQVKRLPQAQMADSSSRNAVSFSSARTTKRFPSSRCASIIQIVRPRESTAETQPQLQPALLRLLAMKLTGHATRDVHAGDAQCKSDRAWEQR
jgi:hypothetical protein